MTDREDRTDALPDGVIDADPPGGWESGETADAETAERDIESIHAPSLSSSGLPPNTPRSDATADAPAEPEAPRGDGGSVEDEALSTDGTDPDLRTDEEVDEQEEQS